MPTTPSEAARALIRRRWDNDPRTSRTCVVCGAAMDTRRLYCSRACRQRAVRERKKLTPSNVAT